MINSKRLFAWAFALQLVTAMAVPFGATAKNEKWEAPIQKFEAQDKATSAPQGGILFIGSSSIVGWKVEKFFPGLPVLNRGFGGSQTSDLLDYYDRVVTPYAPKTVVFYSGDNDLSNKKTPEQIIGDVKELMERIHGDFPHARIIIIPPKPSMSRWALWKEYQELADLEVKLAASKYYIRIMDPRSKMLGEDGKPNEAIFKGDKLHMTDDGYVIWSDMLRPMISEKAAEGKQ